MKIFSGWYSHQKSTWPRSDWIGYAITNQINWCRLIGFDYNFVASPMLEWSKLCHDPGAWAFGSFIKYEAMKVFLDDTKLGDIFFWIDLDIYPNDTASVTDFLNIGQTVLFAPLCNKGLLIDYDSYSCSKMFWSNLQLKETYYAFNSGIFTMSRANVENFFNWLNKDHSMNTIIWWNDYRDKKIAIKNQVDIFLINEGRKHKDCKATLDWIGTDEMLFEDWLHEIKLEFNDYSSYGLISAPDDPKHAKFVHYYGSNKLKYPKI